MAGKMESRSGVGIPFSLTTVMALITVVASLALVSQKLSSSRPVGAVGPMEAVIGQAVPARLWEDPLSVWEKLKEPGERERLTNDVAELQVQLRTRCGPTSRPLLLPVMVSGGTYSEDRESRVRSRFTIVSALGQAGYAPEDSEHIGAARRPWPTPQQLHEGGTNADQFTQGFSSSNSLKFSYEWYRQRTFHPHPLDQSDRRILVLWLDENQFDDDPLLRLAMLFDPLTEAVDANTGLATNVALIGPRTSSTLRAMLPGEFGGAPRFSGMQESVVRKVTNVLGRVTLFSATATAMDEVLVREGEQGQPRVSVARRLTEGLFAGFHNFAASDSQIAAEILDELRLRHVDLTSKSPQHLVLISEWDTFFGRMLSLTYAAELACAQHVCSNRTEFVDRYRKDDPVWPGNLRSFVYLRGLDGQTSAKDGGGGGARGESGSGAKSHPSSLEDLTRWSPDANKAEGCAQFDYLSRLGSRIADLDEQLSRQGRGRVGAIGIVGSDVYDTLLILQALRDRFPEAVFFTTELDARVWHPSEWEWSRNLVVAGGYGQRLGTNLQAQIPPFRDSAQTAQFAATLAALGDTRLLNVTNIPPRRFEIGRAGPVDLSVRDGGFLHPSPPGQSGLTVPAKRVVLPLAGALFFAVVLATLVWRPWRRLTCEAEQCQAESLWLREEDIGGLEGFRRIIKELRENRDPVARWMTAQLHLENRPATVPAVAPGAAAETSTDAPEDTLLTRTEEDRQQEFLDFLNSGLQQNRWVPPEILDGSKLVSDATRKHYREREHEAQEAGPFLTRHTLVFLRENRRLADEVLSRLLEPVATISEDLSDDHSFTIPLAAASARAAGWVSFHQRRARQGLYWVAGTICGVVIFALLASCLRDTFASTQGEPFSLLSGASAWPAEWIRLAAVLLCAGFVADSYCALRQGVLDVTRRYRLFFTRKKEPIHLTMPTTPIPHAYVSANHAWTRYQQMGRWWNRVGRVIPMLAAYVAFAGCIMALSPWAPRPLRGDVVAGWDTVMLVASVMAFLFLTFWTMDAARLCRWFIQHISEAPTRYPKAARDYFSRLRGGVPKHVLNEWLDVRIIAEITERVGRMIYFPFIAFFFLLVARNNWWDRWTWPVPLVIIFALNLALAVTSVLILQHAARRAREFGLAGLEAKLNAMKGAAAHTAAERERHGMEQAEKLLEEIRDLRTGAFVGFWSNPILGALLVPSGGTAVLELLSYLVGR